MFLPFIVSYEPAASLLDRHGLLCSKLFLAEHQLVSTGLQAVGPTTHNGFGHQCGDPVQCKVLVAVLGLAAIDPGEIEEEAACREPEWLVLTKWAVAAHLGIVVVVR